MSIEEKLELQACEKARREQRFISMFETALTAALAHQRAERALQREAMQHLADTTLSASKRDQCLSWLKANPDRCVALVGEQ